MLALIGLSALAVGAAVARVKLGRSMAERKRVVRGTSKAADCGCGGTK